MTGISDILNSYLGKSIISLLAGSANTNPNKTSSILTIALPVLMKAMERNAATPEGTEKLMGSLLEKHDGSILDYLVSLFAGGVDKSVNQDGAEILSSILGNKQKGTK
ncbi:DUF937 domain-containing protein [Polaribacter filamentus]|jgi:hypothetical protein|uniref:DUF937 domain-containing protein n=1 Tax=Polaribacter filamentus TaxID=53483 RepID=UPI0026D5A08A